MVGEHLNTATDEAQNEPNLYKYDLLNDDFLEGDHNVQNSSNNGLEANDLQQQKTNPAKPGDSKQVQPAIQGGNNEDDLDDFGDLEDLDQQKEKHQPAKKNFMDDMDDFGDLDAPAVDNKSHSDRNVNDDLADLGDFGMEQDTKPKQKAVPKNKYDMFDDDLLEGDQNVQNSD